MAFNFRWPLLGLSIIILKKLSSEELYSLLIYIIDHQVTSQNHFDNFFPDIELPWRKNYLTAHKGAANGHLRRFNFKIISNVLYLNKKFFNLLRFNLLCVLFVILNLKQHCMFFINVQLANFFGINLFETDLDFPDLIPQNQV